MGKSGRVMCPREPGPSFCSSTTIEGGEDADAEKDKARNRIEAEPRPEKVGFRAAVLR